MATFFTGFRGRSADREKITAELQSVLAQVRSERKALTELLQQAQSARTDLDQVTKPIAEVERRAQSLDTRTGELDQRLRGFEDLAIQLASLEQQAQSAGNLQRRVEKQLSVASGDADRISSELDTLRDTVEVATRLKDDMAELLTKGDSFAELRAEADDFREQLGDLHSTFRQMRGQHDEAMNLYQGASSRLEKLDERYRQMTDGVADSDRRAEHLDQKINELQEVADKVSDTKRQLDTLNALAGYVTKKIAALEQQRDAVDRATAQGANLQELVRQIDGEIQQQQEKAEGLAEWQPRLDAMRQANEDVLARGAAIQAQQRELDDSVADAHRELADLRGELKKTTDRFDLETRGLDSVGQRIVDLRGSLVETEERFRALEDSRKTIAEVQADADAANSRLQAMAADLRAVEDGLSQARTLNTDVERLSASLETIGQRVGRVEQARPAIDAALHDLGALKQSQEAVRDALEQVRRSHAELTQFREAQRDAETWLAGIAGSLDDLEGKIKGLQASRPEVEHLGKEVDRVLASADAVESRGEFLEGIHARLAELASSGSQLEEREQQLESRMEAAEKRFLSLALQADDAERVERTIFGVTRQVEDAERRMVDIVGSVGSTETRFHEVEALADRVRQLGAELEQRETAVQRASEHLERATALRTEAASMVQDLEGHSKKLVESLAMTEARSRRLEILNGQLEERGSNLRQVEKRIAQFEEQLADWQLAEQEVRRSLDDITQRQRATDALRADVKRLFTLAERAMEDVRAIGAARDEVQSTRDLLEDALARLGEAHQAVEQLDHRKGQLDQAENRLARASALVLDLEASIETLESQRAVVEQVVEQAGVLEFQSKQAEALIETLRHERDLASRIQAAVAETRRQREVTKRVS